MRSSALTVLAAALVSACAAGSPSFDGVPVDLLRNMNVSASDAEAASEDGFLVADRLEGAETAATAADVAHGPELARREAAAADREGDWERADAAYARALATEPKPAIVLNNWGMSRAARGDLTGAIERFEESLAQDPGLFVARNNLAITRAMSGDYSAPDGVAEAERAVLLNNVGIVALRRGDRETARRLFSEAVAVHPRHYAKAAARLAALGGAPS